MLGSVRNGGYERYFLENVRHGIRTAQDLEIWRHMEVEGPGWLKAEGYREAVENLAGRDRKIGCVILTSETFANVCKAGCVRSISTE